jgi:hypothetical protein
MKLKGYWFILIIYLVIILGTYIPLAIISVPSQGEEAVPYGLQKAKDQKDYYKTIYKTELSDNQINKINSSIGYIWDNIPTDLQNKFKIAENMSFFSPPYLNTRYRISAFPFPHSDDSVWKVIKLLVWNTSDQATFPGWMINRYDPQNINNFVTRYPQFFTPNTWIEIQHSCYVPTGCEYPICDDGGYWLYLTPGSGVFYNTGHKPLVANNKIHAIFKLYMELYNGDEEKSWNAMAKKLDDADKMNSDRIVDIVKEIVKGLGKNKNDKIKAVGWKTLNTRHGNFTWQQWLFMSIFIPLTMIFGLITTIYIFSKKIIPLKWLPVFIVSLFVISYLLYMFWWYVSTEQMLRGFGYTTLSQARKKLNTDTIGLLKLCANSNNGLAIGLAMIQLFDDDLECLGKQLGYSCFMLSSQPNKSGSCTVEICDLQNVDCKRTGNIGQGICGPKGFKMGPLGPKPKSEPENYNSSLGNDLYPLANCECCESPNIKCVSCKNHISFMACREKNQNENKLCLSKLPPEKPCQ